MGEKSLYPHNEPLCPFRVGAWMTMLLSILPHLPIDISCNEWPGHAKAAGHYRINEPIVPRAPTPGTSSHHASQKGQRD